MYSEGLHRQFNIINNNKCCVMIIISTRGPAVYQMWYTLAETGTPCTRTGTPWAKTGTHLTVIFEKSKMKICLKIQAA